MYSLQLYIVFLESFIIDSNITWLFFILVCKAGKKATYILFLSTLRIFHESI